MEGEKNMRIQIVLILILLGNCTSMDVTRIETETNRISNGKKINGNLVYSGNKDYLPNFIEINKNSKDKIEYSYTILYAPSDPSDFFAIFNPLLIFGLPIDTHTVTIEGKLNYLSGAKTLDSFVTVSQNRNLWHSPNYTEMRKVGLLQLKKNFEIQFNNMEVAAGSK